MEIKIECIIKSIEQNIIVKASDVLTLHFSFVVCYRVFGRREDTANIFVVNALRSQNSICSSCRRCMKAYFCVKKRTKGSLILSYINYSIKPFIRYVEWYHINVWIDDKCCNHSWPWMAKFDASLFLLLETFHGNADVVTKRLSSENTVVDKTSK